MPLAVPCGALTTVRVRLGAVLPGQGVSVYNDALGRMNGALYYLYNSDNRYYFHAEENLNKVATDRADTLSEREVDDWIIAQLQEAARGWTPTTRGGPRLSSKTPMM